MYLACPAEMLPTLWLKTGRLPVLTENDQVRSVMFTTGLFAFKYAWFLLMACQKVESCFFTKTGLQVFQVKTVTESDKTGIVTDKL